MALQKFGHQHSSYERPTQKWVCGHLADGKPCAIGPNHKGQCQASFECQPRFHNQHWYCSRSAQFGGPCSDGPLPNGQCCNPISCCQPVLSIRAKRAGASFWLTIMTIGILLIILGQDKILAVINPGELSSNHAALVKASNGTGCQSCHQGVHENLEQWFTGPSNDYGLSQSKLCLECHQQEINHNQSALLAHSVPPQFLKALANRAQGNDYALQPLGCANCHREHDGKLAGLKFIADSQCQLCHVHVFDSFSMNHPDFVNYPYKRRTRIIFDHLHHQQTHFVDRDTKFSCDSCHVPDQQQHAMRTLGFAKACASCHDEQINGQGQETASITLLALPGIDVDSLTANNIAIGNWPQDATYGIDGSLSPFMKLLLSADPKVAKALTELPVDIDLGDLSEYQAEQLQEVAQLVWGIKRLFYELTTQGHQALRRRLLAVCTTKQANLLLAALPIDIVTTASQQWFKDLGLELSKEQTSQTLIKQLNALPHPAAIAPNYQLAANDDDLLFADDELELAADDDDSQSDEQVEPLTKEMLHSSGGWYLDEALFAIAYRIQGHQDPFMHQWLATTTMQACQQQLNTPIFNHLTTKKAPGLCSKCHSIEQDSNAKHTTIINWLAKPPAISKRFTRFAHGPHLITPKDCNNCHLIKGQKDQEVMASYHQHNPYKFASGFENISTKTCTKCHNEGGTNQGCLQCHNYHIEAITKN